MSTRFPQLDAARAELDSSPTVSVYAAAVLLGFGEFTVRRAIDSGELPAIRLGARNIRVPSSAIRGLLGMESK